MSLDLGSPIVFCSVADPYVLLLTEDGDSLLLILKPVEGSSAHKLVKKTATVKQVFTFLLKQPGVQLWT